MERITITLPEEMKEYVESQVSSGSYGNTSEFIRDLIRQARKRQAMEKVEQLVLDGINSGPSRVWSKEYMEEKIRAIEKRAEERLAKK